MWQDDEYEIDLEEIRARQSRMLNVIPHHVVHECRKSIHAVANPITEDRTAIERELRRKADELVDDAVAAELDALRAAQRNLAVQGWAQVQGFKVAAAVQGLLEEDSKVVRRWGEIQGVPPSTDLFDFTVLVLLADKYAEEEATPIVG